MNEYGHYLVYRQEHDLLDDRTIRHGVRADGPGRVTARQALSRRLRAAADRLDG